MFRKAALALLLVAASRAPLSAQQWAKKMFETTSHDFGSVARGAKAEFEFIVTNPYVEEVHIASVRSSCGCTSPRIEQAWLKTYQQGAIVAKYNTHLFTGRKGATVTVTFDQPFFAQVQLHVKGYIRRDVVIHPGSVQLGTIDEGAAAEKTVSVNYAGRNDWEITEIKSANPYLSAKIEETSRGGGRVAYQLSVRLDENAPPGYLNDHLVLITNDRRLTQVPLAVEGVVQSAVEVSPTSLFMGVVEPGQKVTKQLMVRSKQPFRIVSVRCDDGSFEFDTSAESAAKPLHLIPVTFVAGDTPGKVTETIRIETDLEAVVPELSAYAVVSDTGSEL